jgi:DNA-binding NtrC family response regulator
MVLELVRKLLERGGYHVLTAGSAEDALAAAAAYARPIRLVISDIVLPRVSGRALVERLTAARPELRVLYMSGYSPAVVARHGLVDPRIPILEKPFTAETVMERVREALA